MQGLAPRMNVYSDGQATFQQAIQTGIHRGTIDIATHEVLLSIRGSCEVSLSRMLFK